MNNLDTYNNLMTACDILARARMAIIREREAGADSPAWVKLYHAQTRLTQEAASILSDPDA